MQQPQSVGTVEEKIQVITKDLTFTQNQEIAYSKVANFFKSIGNSEESAVEEETPMDTEAALKQAKSESMSGWEVALRVTLGSIGYPFVKLGELISDLFAKIIGYFTEEGDDANNAELIEMPLSPTNPNRINANDKFVGGEEEMNDINTPPSPKASPKIHSTFINNNNNNNAQGSNIFRDEDM